MATFKVGQRVRIVYAETSKCLIGKEAIVSSGLVEGKYRGSEYLGHQLIWGDGSPVMNVYNNRFVAEPRELVPLTDPKADEFIERMKKLGREPVIQPVKVTV